MPLKHLVSVKTSLKSFCIFIVNILLALLSVSLFVLDLTESGMFIQLVAVPGLLVLVLFFCSLRCQMSPLSVSQIFCLLLLVQHFACYLK